jgi:Quinolinate synthetase A protein
MKMTTPDSLLRCLRDGTTEVHVPPEIAARARQAVQAMIGTGAGPGARAGTGPLAGTGAPSGAAPAPAGVAE